MYTELVFVLGFPKISQQSKRVGGALTKDVTSSKHFYWSGISPQHDPKNALLKGKSNQLGIHASAIVSLKIPRTSNYNNNSNNDIQSIVDSSALLSTTIPRRLRRMQRYFVGNGYGPRFSGHGLASDGSIESYAAR